MRKRQSGTRNTVLTKTDTGSICHNSTIRTIRSTLPLLTNAIRRSISSSHISLLIASFISGRPHNRATLGILKMGGLKNKRGRTNWRSGRSGLKRAAIKKVFRSIKKMMWRCLSSVLKSGSCSATNLSRRWLRKGYDIYKYKYAAA